MKKEIITLIFIFIIIFNSFGQDCKYESYNYWAGRALLDYSENKFQEANKNLKIAFKKADFPFGTDLAIALKTALETKDTTWAKTISTELAKGGIPIEYFDSFKQYSWYTQFESDYPKNQDSYKEEFDLVLREKIIELRFQDSLFNENYHKWRRGEIEMSLDELIEGARKVTNGFKNIVKEHGFPCEQKMGYYFKEGKVQPFPITIILIHIYQRGELLYKNRLGNIVCDGKLKPTDQTLLNGFKGFGDSTGVEQEMKIRYSKYSPKN